MTLKSTGKISRKAIGKKSKTAAKASKKILLKKTKTVKKSGSAVAKKKDSVKPEIKNVKTILLTQSKPENDKNPYTELAKKYKLEITFKPFINLEGIALRDFRRYKVNPLDYHAIILTSRNAADQFFRICEEMRIRMPDHTRFYCMTEAVALYLQKYILYRKRKVFYGDGTLKGLFREITHHRNNEKYLLPCADVHKSDIADFLKSLGYEFSEVVIMHTVHVKLKKADLDFDMIVFFTPAGVSSLFGNFPKYKQRDTVVGAFGEETIKAVQKAGLRLDLSAPTPGTPSLSMAIDKFLSENKKK